VPVIDGNVYRVLSRLSGIRHPVNNSKAYSVFHKKAARLMDRTHPGEHNQAIMELGALVCLPTRPDCPQCPLSVACFALARGLTGELPVRDNKIAVKCRYFHYLIIEAGVYVYLNHRVEADIWKGLYDFPFIETTGPVDPEHFIPGEEWRKFFGNSAVAVTHISRPIKHRLTHRLITARFYHIRTDKAFSFRKDNYIRTDKNKLPDYPLPKLIENYLLEEGWIAER
jgi:A/G-specific adenine glycosylase